MLNAVADVGLISAFNATPGLSVVAANGFVWRDSLGFLGADGRDGGNDIVGACWLIVASIVWLSGASALITEFSQVIRVQSSLDE